MEQGSEEWRIARMGKVTASRIAEVVATTKSGDWGAGRANYMAELLIERLTGIPHEGYQSADMRWGNEVEPEARASYAFTHGVEIETVGFVPHLYIDDAGASPDGLIGKHGLVEFKCPKTATHIQTILTGKIDKEYRLQMQWQMACTERLWCDYNSYDPRVPMKMRLWTTRVVRDDKIIGELEREVPLFLAELAQKQKMLMERYA